MLLPIGDRPNPSKPQWVTRILLGINVAVYLFVSVPLSGGLSEQNRHDHADQLDRMWEVQKHAVARFYEDAYRARTNARVPSEAEQRLA